MAGRLVDEKRELPRTPSIYATNTWSGRVGEAKCKRCDANDNYCTAQIQLNGGMKLLILGVGKMLALQMLLRKLRREEAYWRPKVNSTSTPEAPFVCVRQRPGAGGRKKKRRRLGTLEQETE